MHTPTPLSHWMFNLDGIFLGFAEGAHGEAPYLMLEVEEEPLPIKFPRQWRDRVLSQCKPGDRLQCIGRSQLDCIGKRFTLEASHIFTAS